MTTIILIIAALAFVTEGVMQILVRTLRHSCPWLITARDEVPILERNGLDSFIRHGWDAELGWVRKPNTSGVDKGRNGDVAAYNIDSRGARYNPGFEHREPEILLYGDSYAFARQVEDSETWAHVLSNKIDRNIANFGVGNYGLDQAVLRLEREFDAHPTPIVIMAVVPESMSRIHAYWKHYSEYGNSFAFKPRFILEQNELLLLPNVIDAPEKFYQLSEFIPTLRRHDMFYYLKFRRDILTFPYMFAALKNPRRTAFLIATAISDKLGLTRDASFTRVMRRNMKLNRALYKRRSAIDLFTKIAERFADYCQVRGAEPIFVFLPQRFDLEFMRTGDHYYSTLVKSLSNRMTVVDAGPALLNAEPDMALFIHDQYGGHYSVEGNKLVANLLKPVCERILAQNTDT